MEKRVNDFSIRVATVNGTGSQSANNILFKSLFRMGIGVCGKNLFPSNIQGLPTWFQIRVSPQGYQNLREHDDIMICLNAETAAEDIRAMREGSTIFYNSNLIRVNEEWKKPGQSYFALPVEELARPLELKIRHLLKNLFYVGALTELYGIDKEVLTGVIRDTFNNKASAIEANLKALEIGIKYARANFQKNDPFELRPGDLHHGKIWVEGNAACALGAVYAGCTVLAWYPITPSSSLAEAMETYFKRHRTGPDGKAKYAVLQAEDELASIGMVVGASFAGARAMTTTSGPGVSLMQEFLGLAYYAEIPAVLVDVQRVGPSTGLPTRTQQCDILSCALASHGDTKHILVIPSTPKEGFEMMGKAFDLAEQFQTPVFVMTDLDFGMNNWVDDELTYTAPRYERGKVLTKEKLDELKDWGRYLDIDGDGIPYRTLPGTNHARAAFFTRGSGHDEYARYTEKPDAYVRNVDRLLKKWHQAKKFVPRPVLSGDLQSKVGVIAYGTTHHAMVETMDRFKGTPLKYLRLRAYPFTSEVEEFLQSCDVVYVVEQNRDGQMKTLLEGDIPGHQHKLRSIRYYGGFPISADLIERELRNQMELGK